MKKILFIGGSLNQTTQMFAISRYLTDFEIWFTPYYTDGFLEMVRKTGLLDFSILGGKFKETTENFFKEKKLQIDYQGLKNDYDLVFTSSDLIMPKNIRSKRVILVQEGMTDPENFAYYLVKYLNFPRWVASTSTTGLSDQYDFFCVASEGYRDFFIKKGIDPKKLVVTGMPNYDNDARHLDNNFPYKDFVLVATSDARETFKIENRKKFIKRAVQIAGGRQMIFKLHPNENVERATKEINTYAPDALVYHNCDINPMIANCSTLITIYSTVVYLGINLGKEVYSEFNIDELRKMTPLQNGGTSAKRIAELARAVINTNGQFEKEKENLVQNFYKHVD